MQKFLGFLCLDQFNKSYGSQGNPKFCYKQAKMPRKRHPLEINFIFQNFGAKIFSVKFASNIVSKSEISTSIKTLLSIFVIAMDLCHYIPLYPSMLQDLNLFICQLNFFRNLVGYNYNRTARDHNCRLYQQTNGRLQNLGQRVIALYRTMNDHNSPLLSRRTDLLSSGRRTYMCTGDMYSRDGTQANCRLGGCGQAIGLYSVCLNYLQKQGRSFK